MVVLASLSTLACSYQFPEKPEIEPVSSVQADFSNTIFIGSSILSGYMDGALYTESESFGISNLIANQINLGSNREFNFPKIESEYGLNTFLTSGTSNVGRFELGYLDSQSQRVTKLLRYNQGGGLPQSNESLASSPALNIPRFRSVHFNDPGIFNNHYANRFGQSLSNSSLVDFAISQNPTFIVFDPGYEDALGYAMAGGEGSLNPSGAIEAYTNADATPANVFEAKLQSSLQKLFSTVNTKGIILTIPDFIDFPYFQYYGYDITPFVSNSQLSRNRSYAAAFNDVILAYNQLPSTPVNARRPTLDFAEDRRGNWGVVITDNSLPLIRNVSMTINGKDTVVSVPSIRHMTFEDYLIWDIDVQLGSGDSGLPLNPIPANKILTKTETLLVNERITAYNEIIFRLANSYQNVRVVDFYQASKNFHAGRNRFLEIEPTGETINGVIINSTVVENGAFSADGIHFNPRGNAWISNFIISNINSMYGSNIQPLDVNIYRSNYFSLEF
ncbi:hypothetical protein [Peijinzhouia sedimentorum]